MSAYYNEIDPYCVAWLRNLIGAKLIADGTVDDRSIKDVQPDDLRGFAQCHFFAGIGGWSYALRLATWPDERPVWTGSCPCQPFSAAGKRKGKADERHLWPEFYRLIDEQRPAIVFGEQVASRDGRVWLAGVRTDLETLGYAVGAADLCAAGAGAPHIRQRLYWVADAEHSERRAEYRAQRETHGRNGSGRSGFAGGMAQPDGGQPGDGNLQRGREQRFEQENGGTRERLAIAMQSGRPERWTGARGGSIAWCSGLGFWSEYELIHCIDGKTRRTGPGIFPLANGIPARIPKLRAAGNAIAPPITAEFIKAFMSCRP